MIGLAFMLSHPSSLGFIRFGFLLLSLVASSYASCATTTALPSTPVERNGQALPPLVTVLPGAEAAKKPREESQFQTRKAEEDLVSIYATVGLTIVTGLLAIFTAGLWYSTYRLSKEAKETSERQAREMQLSLQLASESARAAMKSADVAERALIYTERAFVFLKYLYAVPVLHEENVVGAWRFHAVWENSGSTPTQHMYARKSIQALPAPMPDDFDFPDLGNPLTIPTFIGPKSIIDAGGLVMPMDLLRGVQTGSLHLYMWGWAEYSDVFQPNVRRRSEFCSEILIDGDIATPSSEQVPAPFIFRNYPKHNGTGDECYRKPVTDVTGKIDLTAPKGS